MTDSNQHSRPDLDALHDKLLGLPSNVTMAHELLDLIQYVRCLEEQLEAAQKEIGVLTFAAENRWKRMEEAEEQLEATQDAMIAHLNEVRRLREALWEIATPSQTSVASDLRASPSDIAREALESVSFPASIPEWAEAMIARWSPEDSNQDSEPEEEK